MKRIQEESFSAVLLEQEKQIERSDAGRPIG
jgi:hypothetical protein